MIIKLMPQQVPGLWEAIKLAATRSNEIAGEDVPPYLHELLHALLNDTAQCFVRLDAERTLLSLVITSVLRNKITQRRELMILAFYSFRAMTEEDATDSMRVLKAFATAQGCDLLAYHSRHPHVWSLTERMGWTEQSRCHVYRLNGGA